MNLSIVVINKLIIIIIYIESNYYLTFSKYIVIIKNVLIIMIKTKRSLTSYVKQIRGIYENIFFGTNFIIFL